MGVGNMGNKLVQLEMTLVKLDACDTGRVTSLTTIDNTFFIESMKTTTELIRVKSKTQNGNSRNAK